MWWRAVRVSVVSDGLERQRLVWWATVVNVAYSSHSALLLSLRATLVIGGYSSHWGLL